MKLKKLINKLDGYCYIKVYDIENWKKGKELDASRMVYSGYVDDLPVYWIDYKVEAVIPCFRRFSDKPDLEAGVMVIISQK